MDMLASVSNIIYLPICLYGDGFKPLNALGYILGRIMYAMYIKIPCLPIYLQSKLEFVILVLLYYPEEICQFVNILAFILKIIIHWKLWNTYNST